MLSAHPLREGTERVQGESTRFSIVMQISTKYGHNYPSDMQKSTTPGISNLNWDDLRYFLEFGAAIVDTWVQTRIAILTVATIVGLAYLMNYSGMNYTLGLAVASVGAFFPLVSAFLGWVAVFLSGSDTSGNALFGNLQVVAARQLNLNPILMAATNSSGGVMGKMISPQNISTGVATTELKGKEGVVFAKTFKHSILLTVLLGVLVWLQQNVLTWMIPH